MTSPAFPARTSGRRFHFFFNRAWQALWVLPLPAWLLLFFAVPLGLLVAISFWSVVNYRLTPDATLSAWHYVLGLDFLWASFWRSYGLSMASAVAISLLAFPASYAMAFVAATHTSRGYLPRRSPLLIQQNSVSSYSPPTPGVAGRNLSPMKIPCS